VYNGVQAKLYSEIEQNSYGLQQKVFIQMKKKGPETESPSKGRFWGKTPGDSLHHTRARFSKNLKAILGFLYNTLIVRQIYDNHTNTLNIVNITKYI